MIVAEVDDIGGSITDPVIEFSIKDNKYANGNTKVIMDSKKLSTNERLALHAGAIMQVYVSKIHSDNKIQVSLKPENNNGGKKMQVKSQFEDGTYRGGTNRPPKAVSKPPNGILLNNLKTGMKLEGIVTSNTHYAAFINANIYRAAKGGTFTEVNGMLHRSESAAKLYDQASKGSKITVYVREVYKNSGRFTLTLDPSINKEKILLMKEKSRLEGKERRRLRRIRRQLDALSVGDVVAGTVNSVVPEGVLVSVTSLGPLPVIGLMGTRDLPKQFAVPNDLKPSFQKQLLQQDFVRGRTINCAVSKVSQKGRNLSRDEYLYQRLLYRCR